MIQNQNLRGKAERRVKGDAIAFGSLHGLKFFSSSTASHFAPVPRMVILEGEKIKHSTYLKTLRFCNSHCSKQRLKALCTLMAQKDVPCTLKALGKYIA